ncbi:hypothetical protein ACWDXH_28285 [Micromonospora chokoriensis]
MHDEVRHLPPALRDALTVALGDGPSPPLTGAELLNVHFPTVPARARQRLLDLAQGNPLDLVESCRAP